MYVLTVPDKDGHRMIVNLATFEGVMIEATIKQYSLVAYTDYVAGKQPRSILLVTFAELDHANKALEELAENMEKGKVWDADNAKTIILEGGPKYTV